MIYKFDWCKVGDRVSKLQEISDSDWDIHTIKYGEIIIEFLLEKDPNGFKIDPRYDVWNHKEDGYIN